jgi:hypothetical protein
MAKICFVTSSVFTYGGEQRVTAVLANELAKRHQIVIYTQDGQAEKKHNPYHLAEKIEIRQIIQPRFSLISRMAGRFIREINENCDWLYQKIGAYAVLEFGYFRKKWQDIWIEELKKDHFDLIIAVSGGNTLRLGLISDRLESKTVGWEHNTYEAYFCMPHMYFWRMDQLFSKAITKLDACVVLTEDIQSKYMQAFGKACHVIYNPRSFVSRDKSSLTDKVFVSCGRMIYQKGYDLLLDAFHLYAQKEKEWKLVLVGEGEMRVQLEEKIREYDLEGRVRMVGYKDDVRPYLLQASAYVLSSRWEGFPMVVTEAFEMGLPVIAYDIPAVQPLIKDTQEGLLAQPFDAASFADQLLAFAQSTPEERKKMAQCAIRKAEELSVEKIVKQWEAFI